MIRSLSYQSIISCKLYVIHMQIPTCMYRGKFHFLDKVLSASKMLIKPLRSIKKVTKYTKSYHIYNDFIIGIFYMYMNMSHVSIRCWACTHTRSAPISTSLKRSRERHQATQRSRTSMWCMWTAIWPP